MFSSARYRSTMANITISNLVKKKIKGYTMLSDCNCSTEYIKYMRSCSSAVSIARCKLYRSIESIHDNGMISYTMYRAAELVCDIPAEIASHRCSIFDQEKSDVFSGERLRFIISITSSSSCYSYNRRISYPMAILTLLVLHTYITSVLPHVTGEYNNLPCNVDITSYQKRFKEIIDSATNYIKLDPTRGVRCMEVIATTSCSNMNYIFLQIISSTQGSMHSWKDLLLDRLSVITDILYYSKAIIPIDITRTEYEFYISYINLVKNYDHNPDSRPYDYVTLLDVVDRDEHDYCISSPLLYYNKRVHNHASIKLVLSIYPRYISRLMVCNNTGYTIHDYVILTSKIILDLYRNTGIYVPIEIRIILQKRVIEAITGVEYDVITSYSKAVEHNIHRSVTLS